MQIPSPPLTITPEHARLAEPAGLPILTAATALFLDFDGTLVDIAARPELVTVSPDLVTLLAQLSGALNGALAIVSGRTMADLDYFLSPLQLSSAAEHGAEQRSAGGRLVRVARPDIHEISRIATSLAAEHAGLRVEIKSAAVSLHYRQAPELEDLCIQTLAEAVKRTPGVDMMLGKFVVEVKPAGVNKGTAIEAFMSHAPFAGRAPVFAGDDTTDEAGFFAVNAMGGQAIKVGEGISQATFRCATPALVRQWLKASLESLENNKGMKP